MATAIVWFRNDLRTQDHPALLAAAGLGGNVVPVFVLDDVPLNGRHASPNRVRFLRESLADLQDQLQKLGADLIVLRGRPAKVLPDFVHQVSATSVFATADFSPYAVKRDKAVGAALREAGSGFELLPGRLVINNPTELRTGTGKAYQVFTPFYKAWLEQPRRSLPAPPRLQLPKGVSGGPLPEAAELSGSDDNLSPHVAKGGTAAGLKRLEQFLDGPVHQYHNLHNDLGADATSRLSPYLHFGCLSARHIEDALPGGDGAAAFRRQLAWRDFYHYVLLVNPGNAKHEFQERYRGFDWQTNHAAFEAWQAGRTGYPVVDAAMRQLLQEGYMHNRARLIVGSFLTKDLGLDWRLGEAHFMNLLLDGDEANNNGNWQWIASVGVDPAPVFRRLYNPTKQQQTYDPEGTYVRKYVPELAQVPLQYLAEPAKMPVQVQEQANCVVGKDYPEPIVDHAEARVAALDRYRASAPKA